MNIAIQILLMAVSLWSAHVAGVHFERSRDNPAQKRAGIARSTLSIVAAAIILIYR